MIENVQLATLIQLIEQTIGRKVKSPKDFTFLANCIFDKMGETLSPSTLKRVWGYMPGYATIRPSTLDLLARFVGYSDWDGFCATLTPTTPQHPDTPAPQQPDTTPAPGDPAPQQPDSIPAPDGPTPQQPDTTTAPDGPSGHSSRPVFLIVAVLLVLVIGVALLLWHRREPAAPSASADRYELRTGEVFATNAAYLNLFGIEPDTSWWDEPLPQHDGVYIWGPEYQNPQWHNEGQRDSLMPTITEYYTPTEGLSPSDSLAAALTAEKNRSRLFFAQRYDELRITFMKNLTDTGYVFLGVYRVDRNASDSTRLVWQRVADELDLRHLDRLEQLR